MRNELGGKVLRKPKKKPNRCKQNVIFLMFSYVNICILDDLIGLIIFYLGGILFYKRDN